jgi:hypothetical protein
MQKKRDTYQASCYQASCYQASCRQMVEFFEWLMELHDLKEAELQKSSDLLDRLPAGPEKTEAAENFVWFSAEMMLLRDLGRFIRDIRRTAT